jgi:hypothetical protein
MFRRVCLFAAVALAVSAGALHAQPAPDGDPKSMTGAWEISNAARDRKCGVTFSADVAPGGHKVQLDESCAAVFPSIADAVSWAIGPNQALRLLDPKGGALLEFTEVESGMYEGERKGEGLYFLQSQAALVPARTVEQMFGDWAMLREAGKPLCVVTLSRDTADADSYKLVVKPGCTPAIAGRGLAAWRLEGSGLMLSGRAGTWRFEEEDSTTWQRIPLSTDPLYLVRQ